MTKEITRVLEFWFGRETNEKIIVAQQSALWWGKQEKTDTYIKEEFASLYQSAINDDLDSFKQSGKGQLALIILLDQFSRVIHRDNAAAFAQDDKALSISLAGVNHGIDKSLSSVERVFFYMPMEHAEDIDVQNQCVALFQELVFEVPEELQEEFVNYHNFAKKHQEIIERFNRFPHRNKVLNRISSAEEMAFLAEPGSSF